MSKHFATEPDGERDRFEAWRRQTCAKTLTPDAAVAREGMGDDAPYENRLTRMAWHAWQARAQQETKPADSAYSLDYAMRIAGLWRNGKLIGGDPYAVCASLLAEVDRQRLGREKDQS